MLKNIPQIISPELLKVLSEMGHGDEIVIADGNFPAVANAQRLVRFDGHNVPEILQSVLKLFQWFRLSPCNYRLAHIFYLIQILRIMRKKFGFQF